MLLCRKLAEHEHPLQFSLAELRAISVTDRKYVSYFVGMLALDWLSKAWVPVIFSKTGYFGLGPFSFYPEFHYARTPINLFRWQFVEDYLKQYGVVVSRQLTLTMDAELEIFLWASVSLLALRLMLHGLDRVALPSFSQNPNYDEAFKSKALRACIEFQHVVNYSLAGLAVMIGGNTLPSIVLIDGALDFIRYHERIYNVADLAVFPLAFLAYLFNLAYRQIRS